MAYKVAVVWEGGTPSGLDWSYKNPEDAIADAQFCISRGVQSITITKED